MRVCPRCRSSYSGRAQFCGIDGNRLVDRKDDPLIGQLVGRYRVVAKIGQGASGCVYKAIHNELETEFALKVLFGDLGSDERVVGRFRREAQTASKIRSPHVVSVVDFGTTDAGLSYLAMEYAEGRTLKQVIAREGALPPVKVARILSHVSLGLAAAHRKGLVHRDVKPSNIVVLSNERRTFAKLLDFGIVRLAGTEDRTKLTQVGLVIGTPAYMAPEQSKSSEVTHAADLYSLGVVLFEMLAGQKPFRADTVASVLMMHAEQGPPPLPPSGGLEGVCYHLLEKRPDQRPASAAIVAEEALRIEAHLRGDAGSLGDRSSRIEPVLGLRSSEVGRAAASSEELFLSEGGENRPTSSMGALGSTGEAVAGRGSSDLMDVRGLRPSKGPSPAMTEALMASSTLATQHVDGTVSNPVRPSRLWIPTAVGVLGLLAAFLAFVVLPKMSGEEELGPRGQSAPRFDSGGAESALKEELKGVLGARGLRLDDVGDLAGGGPLLTRWKDSLKAGENDHAIRALRALIEVSRVAPISPPLLRNKLERLDGRLASLRSKLPQDEMKELERRYLQLYQQIAQGTDQVAFDAIARKVKRFEDRLRSLRVRKHAPLNNF